MKWILGILAAVYSSVVAYGSPMVYPNKGTVAPVYTYTAATTGDEMGYFYGSTAAYVNWIGVWVNGLQLGTFALNNHTSKFGESFDFGHVNAGDKIVFALEVTTKGYMVTSDPTMNKDGINHVYTSSFWGETKHGVTIPSGTFVSFEDLMMPHSNLNYNDEDIVFSNLAAVSSAPEPGSLLLLGIGLAGTVLVIRRKRLA